MNQLNVDLGMEEFSLGKGVLRFNPCDPNLYARFLSLADDLQALQSQLQQALQTADNGAAVLALLEETDRKFKTLLTRVFGGENDFSQLMEGVNLLSVAGNGSTVAENLMEALEPVLTQGAERFIQTQTQAAVDKARQRRENQ